MQCTICWETVAIASAADDPEKLALFAERVADDHVECETYKHDLPKARRMRSFRKRTERENKRQRCSRRPRDE